MPTGYWDRQGHRWNDVKYFFLVLIASRKRVAEPIWGGKDRWRWVASRKREWCADAEGGSRRMVLSWWCQPGCPSPYWHGHWWVQQWAGRAVSVQYLHCITMLSKQHCCFRSLSTPTCLCWGSVIFVVFSNHNGSMILIWNTQVVGFVVCFKVMDGWGLNCCVILYIKREKSHHRFSKIPAQQLKSRCSFVTSE